MTNRFRHIIAALLFLAPTFTATPAKAHAIITEATPALNSAVAGPHVPIELHFNSRIDHHRSRLTLVRPDGTSAPLPIGEDSAPDVVAAAGEGLVPGHYRLRWQVLSVDGHITRGDIPFDVTE